MDKYPMVLGEFKTLRRVVDGESIARYGDGEFKMCRGAGIKSQDANPELRKRLREILHESGECMVGIPNIRSDTPKTETWGRQMHNCSLLVDRPYVSSFITRPDSAPWIDTAEYWALLESLWVEQDVTLVRGSGKSFTAERLMLAGARTVTEILAPRQHAFAVTDEDIQDLQRKYPDRSFMKYGELMERIGTPARALLCAGPAATILAVDLCAKGVHAIDLGHAGMFHKKYVEKLPMVVTPEDKLDDNKVILRQAITV